MGYGQLCGVRLLQVEYREYLESGKNRVYGRQTLIVPAIRRNAAQMPKQASDAQVIRQINVLNAGFPDW